MKGRMQTPAVVWFCGRPGSGKSTLAKALQSELCARMPTAILDADLMRCGPMMDLEYSAEDRWKNIVRLLKFSYAIVDQGTSVIVAAVTPSKDMQQYVQSGGRNLALAALVGRRHRPLWPGTTYEEPETPEVVIDTTASLDACLDRLLYEILDFKEIDTNGQVDTLVGIGRRR